MAKTMKRIYDQIASMENIELAYHNAVKHKRYTFGALKFANELPDSLLAVQRRILDEDTAPVSLRSRYLYRPKIRLIWEQSFEQCVITWAFYQVLQPFFVKGYITDTYACIEGRGQDAAVDQLQFWVYKAAKAGKQSGKEWYYLKLDISKFFYRIPHDKLLQTFCHKVSDKRVQEWVRLQLVGSGHRFGLPPGRDVLTVAPEEWLSDRGTPIGTLFAQMSANLFMDRLDQYVKRTLGVQYYERYNDDIVVIMDDKAALHEVKDKIVRFINEELGLETNPKKTAIRPIRTGIEFCGRRIYASHYRLRKSTALQTKRNLKGVMHRYRRGDLPLEKAMQTVTSYQALLDKGNNQALKKAIFGDENGEGGWFVLKK